MGIIKARKVTEKFFWGGWCVENKIHAINWPTMCKSKDRGGLGIRSVLGKNKGLLVKWVWRFGMEESSLWRRVVCAKYGVAIDSLRWDWQCGLKGSNFVKAIGSLHSAGTCHGNLIENSFQIKVGRGDRASFWNDVRVGGKKSQGNVS